jgi:ABC-type phosphate/phosphonate transport system ATPase subunit
VLARVRELARERGLTVILNLHEIQLVQEFADHVAVLKEGRIVYESAAAALSWPALRELIEAPPEPSPVPAAPPLIAVDPRA